MFPGTQPMAC